MSYRPKLKAEIKSEMIEGKAQRVETNCHSLMIRLNPTATGTLTVNQDTILNPGDSVSYGSSHPEVWMFFSLTVKFSVTSDTASVTRGYVAELTDDDVKQFNKKQ